MTITQLTNSQRRFLKQKAHHLKPMLQMGKEGATGAFLNQLLEQLEAHELIKIRILNNCLASDSEIEEMLRSGDVISVQKVGNVLTVFKQREADSWFRLPQ